MYRNSILKEEQNPEYFHNKAIRNYFKTQKLGSAKILHQCGNWFK